MTTRPVVSVVVPISSADAHPRPVVEGLCAALRSGGYASEFVLVLDGPVGGVEREIESIDIPDPMKVVRLQGGGLGESIALSAGVARASGRFLVNMPPYLQIEAEEVLKVVAALEAGADCVATWRSPRVDPWLNQVQSRWFNWLLRLIMGMPFHDLNSGMRGFRRQVLEEVSVYGELYRFLPVMALRQGFNVVEVKVRHREERGRSGFYGVGVYLRRLLDILAITFLTRFTQRPLRFFGYLGFASIVLGAPLAAWYLWGKLAGESLGDKPGFVIGAILTAFGVQLIGFGLIGEIIIFTQAPNLRDYKIDEIVEGGAESPPGHDGGSAADTVAGGGTVGSAGVSGAGSTGGDAGGATASGENAGTAAAIAATVGPAAAIGVPNGIAHAGAARLVPATAAEPRVAEFVGTAAAAIEAEPAVRVRELLPGEDSRWDAFVSRHPQGTFFHLSGWRRCVEEVFRHESLPLVVEQGRRWLGVLPLFLTKSPFLGRNLVSSPYAVYGGVLADSVVAQDALLQRAAQLGRDRRAGYVELRHLEARPGERTRSDLYVTFRKDLPENAADVMPAIPKRARAEVRRALEKGITLRTECDLDLFFELFAENKQRLGSPALPRRWFRALVEEFGRSVVVHSAVDAKGDTLAAVMSFCFRDTLCAYYSGSRTGVNDTGVNNLIYCGIMEWAVDAGFARFDFGRSRAESGPASFKKNMGFTAEPLHYEYLLLAGHAKVPEFHPSNPKLDLPRRIWRGMPGFLAHRLGARLSRYLP